MFIIAGVVGLIVFAAVGYIVWRYRDRGQAIPEQTHGKPALEIALTILPALILIGVAIPTVSTVMALNKTSDTECVINVTGQQWWWEVDYPVQDGCGGVSGVIVTSGQMVIPVGTPVLVRGTSRDVIHSWWIPTLNGKRDMVPGRVQTNRIQADEPGIYAGQCTEFCGLSHANMRMEVIAMYPGRLRGVEGQPARGVRATRSGHAGRRRAKPSSSRSARGATRSTGSKTPTATRSCRGPTCTNTAGAAPNLTNLMTRNTFAGATFDLLIPAVPRRGVGRPPDEVGAAYLEGVTPECLNSVKLREWLRNAPATKPMYADPDQARTPPTGMYRGMPYLALSEDQIDQLVAYLLERK